MVALYDTVGEQLGAETRRRSPRRLRDLHLELDGHALPRCRGAGVPNGARVVSIGPVTSATARERGLEVHVEAERHDIDGLVEALVADAERDDRLAAHRLRARGRVRRRVPRGDPRIAPEVPIVDLTHGITRYGVHAGRDRAPQLAPLRARGRARRDRRPAGGDRAPGHRRLRRRRPCSSAPTTGS